MNTKNLPSITPAQIAAVLTVIVGQAVAWGWVTNDNAQQIISIGSFVLAAVWKIVDAYLRGQRVKALHGTPVVKNEMNVEKTT